MLVADQPCGELEAALAERHAVLVDQQDMVVLVDRDDHRRLDPVGAGDELPFALALGLDPLAFPGDLDGFFAHSSIKRSGSSLVSPSLRGKCCARMPPI